MFLSDGNSLLVRTVLSDMGKEDDDNDPNEQEEEPEDGRLEIIAENEQPNQCERVPSRQSFKGRRDS